MFNNGICTSNLHLNLLSIPQPTAGQLGQGFQEAQLPLTREKKEAQRELKNGHITEMTLF